MSSHPNTLHLEWIPGRFAICRLDPGASIPSWAARSPTPAAPPAPRASSRAPALVSITRTDSELSIVVAEAIVGADAPGAEVERGWSAMRVAGQLDFALVGILATLTGALADADIPCFAISTYDTDYLLVKETAAVRAAQALGTVAMIADPA